MTTSYWPYKWLPGTSWTKVFPTNGSAALRMKTPPWFTGHRGHQTLPHLIFIFGASSKQTFTPTQCQKIWYNSDKGSNLWLKKSPLLPWKKCGVILKEDWWIQIKEKENILSILNFKLQSIKLNWSTMKNTLFAFLSYMFSDNLKKFTFI